MEASFNLRKFDSNSQELRKRIAGNEQPLCHDASATNSRSQMKNSHETTQRQVLGVKWNVTTDRFIFDISDVCHRMKDAEPTKRNAVSLATRFFDPLGIISPITVHFKFLFQQHCEMKTTWDEPLTGTLLAEWMSLSSDVERYEPIQITRYCVEVDSGTVKSYSLLGFFDASQKAYSAIVYLHELLFTQIFCAHRPELHPPKESLSLG